MRYSLMLLSLMLLYSCGSNAKREMTKHAVHAFNQEAFDQGGLNEFFSWTADRIPLVSAHRGGPYPGFPENSIESFEHVIKQTPAVIECDIAMTKDSVLVMMHDYT